MDNTLEILRQTSYYHYFCLLLMKTREQRQLISLWHDAAEIRRIPFLISQPLAGFIRLTWWRDRTQNQEMKNFINTFEFWFEEQTFDTLLTFTQESEKIFFHLTYTTLNYPIEEEVCILYGQCFGIINALQSEPILQITLTEIEKSHLMELFDKTYQKINNLSKKCPTFLIPLKGYLNLWRQAYRGHPIILKEGSIQWHFLKAKLLG